MKNSHSASNRHTGTLLAGVLMGVGAVILANEDLRNKFKNKISAIKEKTEHEKNGVVNKAKETQDHLSRNNSGQIDTAPEQINPTNIL